MSPEWTKHGEGEHFPSLCLNHKNTHTMAQNTAPLTKHEQASAWYNERGITSWVLFDERGIPKSVFISIDVYDIHVSESEISYRAKLYSENIIS